MSATPFKVSPDQAAPLGPTLISVPVPRREGAPVVGRGARARNALAIPTTQAGAKPRSLNRRPSLRVQVPEIQADPSGAPWSGETLEGERVSARWIRQFWRAPSRVY